MRYVRDRIAPASKDHARARREANRRRLAPDPANPGARYYDAWDWFRAAAVYAERRSYRTAGIRQEALARRGQITAEAARMLQEHACEMDAVLGMRRRPARQSDLRRAYDRAVTDAARMEAARQWFMFTAAQVRRAAGEAAAYRAALIQDQAAARLIEWAEEMDADDYGE